MHNRDADSEGCLNRQILNNSVEGKQWNTRVKKRKLIRKELRREYLDNLTYEDIRKITRNMRKARSSQLLPLQTDIEEIHEALISVHLLIISTELAC